MPQSIRHFIAATGIVDVHEHHIPEILLSPDVNLLDLFQQSYAGWTQARPYTLPNETRDVDPMLAATPAASWDPLAPYFEKRRSHSLGRNLLSGILELHAPKETAITAKNWKRIDSAVREKHRSKKWVGSVLKKSKVETVITDPYTNPLLNPVP